MPKNLFGKNCKQRECETVEYLSAATQDPVSGLTIIIHETKQDGKEPYLTRQQATEILEAAYNKAREIKENV